MCLCVYLWGVISFVIRLLCLSVPLEALCLETACVNCVYTLLCGSVVCVTFVYNGESVCVCVWICEFM